MRRPMMLIALALAVVAAMPARAALLGDAALSYSAERTVTINGQSYTGMVFHVPGRDRHEQAIQGVAEVVILDAATKRGWLVLPGLRSYVDFAFPQLMAELGDPSLLRHPVGRDTVNGVRTTRFLIEHTAADGMRAHGFAWVSPDGVLMRLDGWVQRTGASRPIAIRMELDKVKPGRQDPALFDLPPGLVRLPGEALQPLLGGKSG